MPSSRFIVPEGNQTMPPPPGPSTTSQKLSHALPLPFHLMAAGMSTVGSVVTAVAAHVLDGPVKESWNLATSVVVAGMRSVMVSHPPQGRHSMSIIRGVTSRLTIPFAVVGARGEYVDVSVKNPHHLTEAVRKVAGMAPVKYDRDVPSVRNIPAEWVVHKSIDASQIGNSPIVLYLHGGAHIFLSPRTHRIITSEISRVCRARVLALDYRLIPEHPFPSAVEDALAAYCALINQQSHGFSSTLSVPTTTTPNRIIIMGDSSGGCLTLQLMQTLKTLDIPLPAGAVLLSPLVDHSVTSPSWAQNFHSDFMALDPAGLSWALDCYAGEVGRTHPLVSPLFGDLTGLPPLLIQAGEAEVLADDAKKLHSKALSCGLWCELQIYKDMFHVFHTFPTQPETTATAFNEIGTFVSRTLSPQNCHIVFPRSLRITCMSGKVTEERLPTGEICIASHRKLGGSPDLERRDSGIITM
ncbi:uncharacterized protein SPPG_03704 [Spizellomyces punctatus DAOM BR117]|uniref:Alpha/beta hydrolase fold-3 domain-containing protein n=1 Tax=Spizellomyces punctatus (strain DAOM BR117) TaxID=645134 RepID=A0A0L0HI95_SPIPD|nr:uncharacterized protein SPPG_03704 [Spizellomyces punctatus DAOM BR117]KND00580.1 hypothetical protein SPPG_03704 [Spizellomyces punctatus DAOM BR117]|eukprot:XP_016608619.1 hypothetical protein SPPG_03704 [Spizellomyces punctatus DAOM BR117]